MLRTELQAALKVALKSRDDCSIATLRLILAALKDRDITARGDGREDGIADDEILAMLQTMIRQRDESIALFERGGRKELADRERQEIEVIRRFLPRQLSDTEIAEAVQEAISRTAASGLKDMGRVMSALRSDHAGAMNFGKASEVAKKLLSAA